MGLFNETDIIYSVVSGLSNNVTGSVFLTLLLITAGIMLFAFAFRIPLEFTVILIFPLLVAFAVEGGAEFFSVLGVAMIYISVLIAKNFFFWR